MKKLSFHSLSEMLMHRSRTFPRNVMKCNTVYAYLDIRVGNVVLEQFHSRVFGFIFRHEVQWSGGTSGQIWVHKPHSNRLNTEEEN